MPIPRVLAVALICCPSALAQATPTLSGVQFGDGHQRQVLDIYLPQGAGGPRPAVIWIHGGGWRSGSRAGGAERAPLLLERGIALVAIEYRWSSDAIFPAQIHDCKAAVRWLRANAAAYNIDPDRIGVWGASSGGHLAALMGTAGDVPEAEGTVGGNLDYSSRVAAVADYYGHTDFFTIEPPHSACNSSESRLLGACLLMIQQNSDDPEMADAVARARLASPVAHVSPDDPPFTIIHGGDDTTVSPEQSRLLHAALEAAGVPSHLRILEGVPHDIGLDYDPFTVDFFAAHLGTPGCIADWDNSGSVDSADIAAFLASWIRAVIVGNLGPDVDGSGLVNSADISAYLVQWLPASVEGCHP